MSKIQLQDLRGLSRDYFLLTVGNLVSKFGSSIFGWAISWWVLELTGSKMALALTLTLTTLPVVIISSIGGAFIDKYSKKVFIVGTDLIRGIIFILLTVMIWQGYRSLTLIYGVVLVEAIFKALFRPAVFAALPLIVQKDKIYQAKAINQVINNLATLLAPMVSAILLQKYGIILICLVNGISFICSAISEAFIQIKEDEEQLKEKVNLRHDLAESWRLLSKIKVLYSIVIMMAIINVIVPALAVMLPMVLIKQTLGLEEGAWGLFRTLFIIGGLCGSTILAFIKTHWSTYQVVFIGMMTLGAIYFGMGATVNYSLLLILSLGNGVINSIVNVSLSTLTTTMTPQKYLGKISGLTSAISNSFVPLSYLLGSFISHLIGVRELYCLYGLLFIVIVWLIMGRKEIRQEARKTVSI